MVFGEPDIEVRPTGDGQLTVEVCGLDVAFRAEVDLVDPVQSGLESE